MRLSKTNRGWVITTMTACLGLFLFGSAVAQEGAAPTRADIEDQYKWDLSHMFADQAAWEAAYAQVETMIPRLEAYKGKLGESAATLLACLRLRDSANMINDDLFVYAGLLYDQDQQVSANQELQGRSQTLNSKLGAAVSFVDPEMLELGEEKLHIFLNELPDLQLYSFYIEDMLRTQEHTLSPREEELLSMVYPIARGPRNIFNAFNNADVKFGTVIDGDGNEVEMTRQRYYRLLESPDQAVRRRANEVYVNTYHQYVNGMATTLATSLQSDWFFTQARGYKDCLERRLDQDNIPPEVFYSLIEAVNNNLAPLNKWTSIKKRILGLDTLYSYDQNAPLIDREEPTYTAEEAKALVLDGLSLMGEEYLNDIKLVFDSRWIDFYETQGKRGGAYNWGTYSHHPYILLNFVGSIDNVFTLAHESGHALHAYYRHQKEPYIYGGATTFTAEVASTAQEAMMMKYFLDNTTDPKEKLALLIEYIEQIEGTFYTQVFFSEFELAMHKHVEEGGAFSADFMRGVYRDLYQKYWGPDVYVDPLNDMGCVRISHFYRNYYVFQYATSYAAAQVMAQRVLNNEPGGVEAVKAFLHTGSSKYPIDVLKEAGIDLTQPAAVDRTIALFAGLVDEVEKLLDEQ